MAKRMSRSLRVTVGHLVRGGDSRTALRRGVRRAEDRKRARKAVGRVAEQ